MEIKKCKFEFCDWTTDKGQGALNLHQRACKHNPDLEKNKEKVKEIKEEKENICPDCGAEMVLLNPRYKAHKEAINDGYSLICSMKGCGEIV